MRIASHSISSCSPTDTNRPRPRNVQPISLPSPASEPFILLCAFDSRSSLTNSLMSIRSSKPWRVAVSLEAAVVDTRCASFRPTNRTSLDLCSNASRASGTCHDNHVSVSSARS